MHASRNFPVTAEVRLRLGNREPRHHFQEEFRMLNKLDKSIAQKTFALIAKALLVTIIASLPICARLGFAAMTGRF
jgi:hypothetical protein